jgi:hypothetical protein
MCSFILKQPSVLVVRTLLPPVGLASPQQQLPQLIAGIHATRIEQRYSSVSFKQCRGSSLVSMGMRIQPFISVRIRIRILIQESKPMRIQADLILIILLGHKKLNFYIKNILKM